MHTRYCISEKDTTLDMIASFFSNIFQNSALKKIWPVAVVWIIYILELR